MQTDAQLARIEEQRRSDELESPNFVLTIPASSTLEAKNYELLNESLRMEEEVISRQAHVGELKEELHNAADTNLELRSELTKQKSEMQAWCDATWYEL